MITLEISVPLHSTESKTKVKKALKTLFPTVEFTLQDRYITGMSHTRDSLNHFKELLKNQKIRDTANTILKRSLYNDTLVFYLNKQAAFMGKVNFSRECPLDPITVSIKGENLDELIDELSPRTAEQ
jgi:predicted RNA binding protein with dsRBD fold (UPF0201 family)